MDRDTGSCASLPVPTGTHRGIRTPLTDLLLGTRAAWPVLILFCPPSLLLLAKPIKLLPWPQLRAPRPGEETTEEASLHPSSATQQLVLMRMGYS